MKLEEFIVLEPTTQRTVAFEIGAHLGDRFEPGSLVSLYQVDSFYVEAFYQPRTRRLLSLVAFTDTDRLLPYLNHIDLSSLKQIATAWLFKCACLMRASLAACNFFKWPYQAVLITALPQTCYLSFTIRTIIFRPPWISSAK
jgi:hypothetical protein